MDELSNVDHVVTRANSTQFEAQLHIFEDSEVVIKMLMKGRGPTPRHVSRTHRVAFDLSFRFNLDAKIQSKMLTPSWHQIKHLADMLTEGNVTRDE